MWAGEQRTPAEFMAAPSAHTGWSRYVPWSSTTLGPQPGLENTDHGCHVCTVLGHKAV